MPDPDAAQENVVELEELLLRPGTYFNPQTEVVVIVDDSASVDQEIFNMEAYEGADWVRIADDVPIDDDALDVAMQSFQARFHPSAPGTVSPAGFGTDEEGAPADEDDEPELEPDPEPEG